MANDKNWFVGLPAGDHVVSSKLGRYFAATSYLEFSILMCMAAALGDGQNLDDAFKKLRSCDTISKKIHRLEDVSKSSKFLGDYKKKVVIAACAHMRTQNKSRNDYAHGLFEHSSDGAVRIRPYGLKNHPSNSPRILNPARIEGDIMQLDVMLRTAEFVAGMISREQLQPYIDRLTTAERDAW